MYVRKTSGGINVCQDDVWRNECMSGRRLEELLYVRKTSGGMNVCQDDVWRNDCMSGRRLEE